MGYSMAKIECYVKDFFGVSQEEDQDGVLENEQNAASL
jgi:hypothetical protein